MAKVIAVANQKGGVGKTTTTYNLAASISKTGKTVLMVDMDPQYSLTESCACVPDAEEFRGMDTRALFRSNVDPLDCCFTIDAIGSSSLFLVPSTQNLALTAKQLFTQTAGLSVFKSNIDKLRPHFDYIFFDCPPSLDELLMASLLSSDGVIIPVKPERLSYAGLNLILPTIESVRTEQGRLGNPDLQVIGMIATMFRASSSEHREYKVKIDTEQNLLGVIPLSTIVIKEVAFGLPVVLAHPNAAAAKEYERIALTL